MATLTAGIALMLTGAAQANETFPVRIVPVDGFEPATGARILDLAGGTTYVAAQAVLDSLRTAPPAEGEPDGERPPILVPLGIPGLADLDLPNTSVTASADAKALVLTSAIALNGSTIEASLVFDWTDDLDSAPDIAIVLHGDDVSLSTLNAAWPSTSIVPALDEAWVMLTPNAHTLEGTVLQTAVGTAVPDEDVLLAGGATFRAVVDAGTGPLGEAVRQAGLDASAIALQGSFGVDGSVLSGASPDLSVGASLGLDPGAPDWLVSAAAELSFELVDGAASIHIGGEYAVDLDGEAPNTFAADLTLDASSTGGAAELLLRHDGDLVLPAPLDWLTLGDASLGLRYDGGLSATLHGEAAAGSSSVAIDAALVVRASGVSLDASVVGPVAAADVARLLGQPLGGFDDSTLAGLDGVELSSLAFSFADDASGTRISGTGAARFRDADVSILLSARKPVAGAPRLMAGLHLGGGDDGCCATLGDLLGPDIGDVAAAIPVPSIDLVFLGGAPTLGEADLDGPERAFFAGVYGDDLSALAIRPGLSLATRIPVGALDPVVLELLGLDADDEVVLDGYVGTAVGAVAGAAASDRTGIELKIDLPETEGSSLLPDWLDIRSDWDLEIKAVADAVALRASAAVHVAISDQSWDADLVATFEKDPTGVRASLDATLGAWEDPFGLEWFDLDGVHVNGSVDRPTGGITTAAVSVEAGFTITAGNADPKRFTVAVAVEASDTVRGTFTAKLLDPISLGDVLLAVGAPVGDSMPPQLSGTSIGPVSISAAVGGGLPASLSIFATGNVQLTESYDLEANLLASVSGSRFTLGIRPETGLSLGDVFPPELGLPTQMDIPLPNLALAVSNLALANVDDDALTDEEQTFWAPIYGCDPEDLSRCEYKHTLPAGVSGIASVGLPADVQEALDPFALDFSQPAMMRGTLPIFGGSFDPNLTIKLPAPRIDAISEFFEGASLDLRLDKNGVSLGGELAMRMPRLGEGPGQPQPCRNELVAIPILQADGSYEDEDRCYDVLRFGMRGDLIWRPTLSISLTGTFTADGDDGWMSPFGVGDWIGVKRLAAQFSIIPSTATFSIGFGADFRLLGKDAAGSIALALNVVAPSPPFVIPELLGFRLSSASGLAFQDLVDVQHEFAKVASLIAGAPTPPKLDLPAAGFPNLALRNLDLMYARQSNPALCMEVGFVISADLYVNPTAGAGPSYDGAGQCRTLPSQAANTNMTPACVEKKAEGCFASVQISVTMDGLLASGNIANFDLGPIHWSDSFVDLALTLTKQHLALKGAAALDGVFSGNLELAVGLQGFKLKGDVDLFNGAGGAYIEALAPIDLANPSPSLSIHATMHADFEDAISAAIDQGVAPIRTTAVALDVLWDSLLDLGDPSQSSADVLRALPQKLRNAGLSVPREVDLMISTIAEVEAKLKILGSGSVLVDMVLNGVQLPDFPGWQIPLIPATPTCLGWTVQGACWLVPPIRYEAYDWWNLFCFCPGPSWVHVPARWDYTFAIPGIVAQPTCIGEWDGSRCWALGLRPFSFPEIPGVCDLTPGLTPADLGRRCTLRDVMEKAVGPVVGQAISVVTGQPAPTSLSAFLDQIVGGLKAAGGLVKVECATFELDIDGGPDAPSARTELALAMSLFGEELSFGAAWDFSDFGTSIGELPFKVIDQLIHPTPVECEKRVSTIPPSLELSGADRVDEDGTQTITGTFATAADRSVTLDWGDGTAPQVLATTGSTFTATHRYVDDDPTGAPSATYVIKASYTDGEIPVAGSRLLAVVNLPPTNLAVQVTPVTEGGTAGLTGSFTDTGTNDTHTVVIDWGDGSQPITLTLAKGDRTFSASRGFPSSGSFPLSVIVVDDDTGRTSVLQTITVANAAPSDLALSVDADAIDEGQIATLHGTFTDPGADDLHTVTVDWGDGSEPETFDSPPGGREFTLGHRFFDDVDGTISVTVEDDEGASVAGTAGITVSNVAPSDVFIGTAVDVTEDGEVVRGTVGEGTTVEFSGSFADPGVADAHIVTIDWGAGTEPTTIALPAGESSFGTTHLYADDDPTATASDVHEILVTVVDDDGGTGSGASEITIENSVASELSFGPLVAQVDEGAAVRYRGTFLDAGLLDDHTVTIDWGDGTAPTVLAVGTDAIAPFEPEGDDARDPGHRTFEAMHTYADDGASGDPLHHYPMTVTVVDDDTSAATLAVDLPVHNVAPSGLALGLVATTIDEDGIAELSGTFADPGTPDTHTVVVDWGDGSAPDTIELDGAHAFGATHRYLDDTPSGTSTDVHQIAVEVVDDDTGATAGVIDIRVDDVRPSALTFTPTEQLDEGSSVRWNGTFVDPGTRDTFEVVVDWGDGTGDTLALGAAARAFVLDHTYVDDDPTASPVDDYEITVSVTDDDTLAITSSATHVVHDVAPSALVLAVDPATFDEHGTTTLTGDFVDPGARDTFEVVVDWGEGTVDTLELPALARTFSITHQYGDDGTFPITVRVTDDDSLSTTTGNEVTVGNVAPTLGVDRTDAQWIDAAGGLTVTARAAEERTFSARSTDVGSDDLTFTWTWGDGTTSSATHRNDAALVDPDPSPTVGPRDVRDTQTHAWATPCLYSVPVDVGDDDGGTAPTDAGWVVVTGTSGVRHGTGWWHSRYDGRGGNDLAASVQACYLRIVEHASAVFGDARAVGTNAQATAILTGAGSDARDQLDRMLLSLWLDYADGAFRWTDPVDTDGDRRADATFSEVMKAAEQVRLDGGATRSALQTQRQRLQRMVLPGQRPPTD